MGAKKVDAVEWTCDSCGKKTHNPFGEDGPKGWYTGQVRRDDEGATWAACSKSHIKSAVLGALSGEPYPGDDDERSVDGDD